MCACVRENYLFETAFVQCHPPGKFIKESWASHTGTLCLVLSCSVVSGSFATPWTIAHQAPLSMAFPRQEYWSELPSPTPGDLLDPGIKLASPALVGGFFTTEPPGKPDSLVVQMVKSLPAIQETRI